MPRYNRRKSRWNTERGVQGAISGGAYGFSVGGPKGAAVGTVIGGVTGGLSGKDTSFDRGPYDKAIREFSYRRRGQARVASDESSARAGASLAARGLNTSELGAGVISANRGRYMRQAEDDISEFSSNVEIKIAEAEYQAQMADDEETRQGWLDLATQLGMQALSGDFTPKTEIDKDMIASLRQTDPKSVQRWLSGRMSDEELLGVYERYNKIYGDPGTLDRRFSDLEHGKGKGSLPKAILPEGETPSEYYDAGDPKSMYEKSRRDSVPTSPDGTQGEPPTNIEGKPIAPPDPGDEKLPAEVKTRKDKLREVVSPEDMESLKLLYPDLDTLLGATAGADAGRRTEGSARGTEAWREEKSMPQKLDTPPTSERQPQEEQWGAGESDWGFWNSKKEQLEKILENPASEYVRKQAQRQLEFVENEIHRLQTGGNKTEGSAGVTETWQQRRTGPQELDNPPMTQRNQWGSGGTESVETDPTVPAIPAPGVSERAEEAHEQAKSRWKRPGGQNTIPRREPVEPPPAERKGKSNRLENPPAERSVGRFREMEAEAPPPPPDLDNVRASKTPIKSVKSDTSSGSRYKRTKSDTVMAKQSSTTPLINEANKWVGKMEKKDKTSLMKYFDAQGIEYFGESFDPTTTPWCAAFLESALKKAGYETLGTETYAAREYMKYGTESTGEVGDIAVWENHVGIVVKFGTKIKILGGNQKDGVTIVDKEELDKKTRFLGYRTPVKG